MITVMAPYDLPTESIVLNGPEYNDTISATGTLKTIIAKDSTKYTYIKRRNRRKWNYKFLVDLELGLKLKTLITNNTAKHLRVVTSDGDLIRVLCVNDSFVLTANGRRYDISLTFEGEIIHAANVEC